MPSMTLTSAAAITLALPLWLATAAAQPAHAARTEAHAPDATARSGAPAPQRQARASRRKPRIVHLPSPAEESPAQRDRRLARECRGLPNAGACLGHAATAPRSRPQRR